MTARSHPLVWREGQPPRSALFGDLFYSAHGGLAEARQVFLAGCNLPQAWRDRRSYCVAELGFGSGLNILALLDLWARCGPSDAILSVFSIDAFPITALDAARALAEWPELATTANTLLAQWPGLAHGFHRLDLPQFRAIIDLAVMDVSEALEAWSGRADAWFLDGFSPALNPKMWRSDVLELVARRSAPGARLATYSVAGEVRRGLASVGFEVSKSPGFGRKRERLEARWPGEAVVAPRTPSVAVLGSGIAGASLCRAFNALGVAARMFDSAEPAASASPAALVTPRLDAGLGPQAALFASAFARARALYSDEMVISSGALQLALAPKDLERFAAIAASALFESDELTLLDPVETSRHLMESAPASLEIRTALVVDPGSVLDAWRGETTRQAVQRLIFDAGGWRLLGAGDAAIAEAEIVCVACAMASRALIPGLDLSEVRGQASLVDGVGAPATALFGGYVAPTRRGLMFGATHDRGDDDVRPRPGDHKRNLAALAQTMPALASRLADKPMDAHVGVRATTSDYLPHAGPAPAGAPGLFVLTGLGSRGFTLAPLLAEHVAALALGAPSPLPRTLAELVDPARFARRARRKGR